MFILIHVLALAMGFVFMSPAVSTHHHVPVVHADDGGGTMPGH
jgi:hypothetical protein